MLSNWQVYFTVYGKLKHELASGTNGQLSVAGNVLAAVGAGTASALVSNPLWVVKTRIQVLLFFLLLYFYDKNIFSVATSTLYNTISIWTFYICTWIILSFSLHFFLLFSDKRQGISSQKGYCMKVHFQL